MWRRVDPWVLGALGLGTLSFFALPYSLYVLTVLAVLGFMAALVFLFLSPVILTVQYLRYRRGSRIPSFDEG